MEASSIEDNEILQDKWAGLLASASEKSDSLSPSFVETLKELTPNEAKVLHSLFEVVTERDFTLKDAVRSVFKSGEKDPTFQSSIKTFERLGLVDKEYKLQEAAGSHFYKAMRDSAQRAGTSYVPPFVTQALERPPDLSYEFRFTEYGIQFMKACQGPTKTG